MKEFLKSSVPFRLARKVKHKLFPIKIVVPEWHIIKNGPLQGKRLYLANDGVWKEEMINGTYERDMYGYLQKLDLKGKTVIDIGAHIGYYSMMLSEIVGNQGKVFAFEPNPLNYERLENNISGNEGLSKLIKTLPYALSDKNGEEDFLFEPRVEKLSSTGGFLDRSDTAMEKTSYEKKRGFVRKPVQTRTLDSLRADGSIDKPDLIKIDIEGGEYLMLPGARETLLRDRPVLLIEVHSIFNMWKVCEELKGLYRLTLLKENPDGRCFFEARKE